MDYHDPFIPSFSGMRHYPNLSMKSVRLTKEALKKYDCAAIITNHSQLDYRWIVEHSSLVVDTRNAAGKLKSKKIVKA